MSQKGKTIKEFCELYGAGRLSISNLYYPSESEGIKGLELKPGRDRSPKLQVDDQKRI